MFGASRNSGERISEDEQSEAVEISGGEDAVPPAQATAPDGESNEMRTLFHRVKELEAEINRLRSEVHEQEMLRIREQATLQREKTSFELRVRSGIFLELLTVVDSFGQLTDMGSGEESDSALLQCSRAVLGQLMQMLARNGVRRIPDLVGKPYDSATSQIAQVVLDAVADPGTVVEVLRDGYMLDSRLVRPAMVNVAGAAQGDSPSDREPDK
jgi:molecular chaperone GrpE